MSLAQAREERQKARELISRGIDPAENRKKQQRQDQETFEAVAREWHQEHSSIWEEGNTKKIIRSLENDVFPFIGNRRLGTRAGAVEKELKTYQK